MADGEKEERKDGIMNFGKHLHSDHNHAGGPSGHAHRRPDFNRAFAVGIGLNLAYVAVEATFGLIAGSLALLADAGHNLSDVLGLALAWGAARLAARPATPYRTYGMQRSTILAALLNTLLLILAIGAIAWEAIRRFGEPVAVESGTVIWAAAAGVAVNAATTLLFLSGRKRDLNIRGAFLHMAADTLVSVGVVAAGIVIGATGWLVLDPVISLVIVVVIGIGTWGLLRDSVDLALDAVPKGIDPDEVRRFLEELPGIAGMHDLHIWGMSTSRAALTAHLIKPDPEDDDTMLMHITGTMRERFGIDHITIQWERSGEIRRIEGPEP